MERGYQYDSRKPLVTCEFPELGRQVGVCASTPFFHVGRQAQYVDLFYERVTVNTATFGNPYPETEWKTQALDMTKTIIKNLDNVIEELTRHRERMIAEAHKLGYKKLLKAVL
jgi:hypothetical protein